MRFTCRECGIAFEINPSVPPPCEDSDCEPHEDARTAVASGLAGHVFPEVAGKADIGTRNEAGEEEWTRLGLSLDFAFSRGMMVSGRRRVRAVVQSVTVGSPADSGGVQVRLP